MDKMTGNALGSSQADIASALKGVANVFDNIIKKLNSLSGVSPQNGSADAGSSDASNVIASLQAGESVNGSSSTVDWSAGSAYLPKYKSELNEASKLDSQGYHQAAEALRTDVAVSVLSDMKADGLDISSLKDSSGNDLLDSMSSSLGQLTTDSMGVEKFEPGSLMLSAISELAKDGKSMMDAMPEDHFKQNGADAKQKTDWLESTTTFFADLNCLGSTNDDLAGSVTSMIAAKEAGNESAASTELMSGGLYLTDLLSTKMDKDVPAYVTSDVVNSAVEDDPLAGVQAGNNVKSDLLINSFNNDGEQNRSAAEVSPMLALLQSFQAVSSQVQSCVQSTL